jgi:hypothetical protein
MPNHLESLFLGPLKNDTSHSPDEGFQTRVVLLVNAKIAKEFQDKAGFGEPEGVGREGGDQAIHFIFLQKVRIK